jgi:hypothetical protein
LATACLVATGAGAATYYVDLNYSGTETGSDTQPFNTIREAVAAANANAGADTILIAAGTYNNALENWSGSGQFEVINGNLTVRGGYGGVGNWASRTPRSTIIDLAGAGTRAFYDNDVADITLDGLTCVNGSAPATPTQGAGQGGFLYVYDFGSINHSVMVTNCLFTNNTAVTGGALYILKPLKLTITGCDFRGNSSTGSTDDGNGGGAVAIGANNSNPQKVENCTFTGNTAVSRGGAIVIQNADTSSTVMTITNCTIVNNTSNGIIQANGGDNWQQSDLRVRNSIVALNGLVGISAKKAHSNNVITLEYNCVYGNSVSNYALDATAGTGSVSVDPKFNAAASGDYRLTAGSSLLDSGTNLNITIDLPGITRPEGAGPAMGCYERGMAPAGTVVAIR